MRIAITGPTGSIGTELVNYALDQGHEVLAVVRPGSGRNRGLTGRKGVKVIESDISSYRDIMGTEGCDLFFHLAWRSTAGAGRDDAELQLDNVRYTLDAVRLAESWGARAFVGAGSQAEYGIRNERLTSGTPVDPQSGYGIAKYTAGRLAGMLCSRIGIKFNWVRILSVYGRNDNPESLIMYLIRELKLGNSPELTECGQIWDYLYSKDAARALFMIAERGIDGKTYPLGSGDCRKLREYVETVRDIVAPDIGLQFGKKSYYPHQPMVLCADIDELRRDTGFVPAFRFEEGIRETIQDLLQ